VHEQTGAQFAYVGPKHEMPLVRQALRYKGPGQVGGWFLLEEFPKAIAEFDLGIVPLENNTFNDSKSWLKGLELASLGVPFVASPTPDYRKLHGHGVGLLAESRNQWVRQLCALVHDPEAGPRMREQARALRLSANVHLWWEAYEHAASLASRSSQSVLT
jgi:glycosyltransferase involved in cell wall biosynthesis